MKAVIFDLDGVLVFTDKFHYLAWKQIADKLNIKFDQTINSRLRGISRMDSLNIILENSKKEFSIEEKTALCQEKNAIYLDYLKSLNGEHLNNDVVSVLTTLKSRGYLLAVGSSSKNATFILDKLNLTHFFDGISDGNLVTNSKPNPEVFLIAAEKLNISPSECYCIDDGLNGIMAGKNAGMKTVAIYDSANFDLADYKINSLSQLLLIAK